MGRGSHGCVLECKFCLVYWLVISYAASILRLRIFFYHGISHLKEQETVKEKRRGRFVFCRLSVMRFCYFFLVAFKIIYLCCACRTVVL